MHLRIEILIGHELYICASRPDWLSLTKSDIIGNTGLSFKTLKLANSDLPSHHLLSTVRFIFWDVVSNVFRICDFLFLLKTSVAIDNHPYVVLYCPYVVETCNVKTIHCLPWLFICEFEIWGKHITSNVITHGLTRAMVGTQLNTTRS